MAGATPGRLDQLGHDVVGALAPVVVRSGRQRTTPRLTFVRGILDCPLLADEIRQLDRDAAQISLGGKRRTWPARTRPAWRRPSAATDRRPRRNVRGRNLLRVIGGEDDVALSLLLRRHSSGGLAGADWRFLPVRKFLLGQEEDVAVEPRR